MPRPGIPRREGTVADSLLQTPRIHCSAHLGRRRARLGHVGVRPTRHLWVALFATGCTAHPPAPRPPPGAPPTEVHGCLTGHPLLDLNSPVRGGRSTWGRAAYRRGRFCLTTHPIRERPGQHGHASRRPQTVGVASPSPFDSSSERPYWPTRDNACCEGGPGWPRPRTADVVPYNASTPQPMLAEGATQRLDSLITPDGQWL